LEVLEWCGKRVTGVGCRIQKTEIWRQGVKLNCLSFFFKIRKEQGKNCIKYE
jgi:hypothetical protein